MGGCEQHPLFFTMKKEKTNKKKTEKKQKEEPRHMFASKSDYIDYAFGDDPIMCQALKNCEEE